MTNRASESRIKVYLNYAECSRLKAKPIKNYEQLKNLRTHKLKNLNSVHIVIVLLVFTTRDVVHPLLVIEVPRYSFLDTLFKLKGWSPTLRRQRRSASPHCGRIDIQSIL